MPSEAEQRLAAGEPAEALASLQAQVRKDPADVKLRIFLFQLLCVLGQWQRASTQLEVCGEMDAATLAMVNTYREALKCELVREAVFAGKTTPIVLGQPQEWAAWLVEALQADARGDAAAASRLRTQAFEMAPASVGTLNGEPFEWIADADSRIGPVLEVIVNGRYSWLPFAALAKLSIEPPEDLRDFVWLPAHVEFPNGGDSVALVPTRYPLGGVAGNSAELLARSTAWETLATDQYAGRGERVIATSGQEIGLLALRELAMGAAAA
ncbi:MAG TPA: type VI secretion system accessory protein TagJ [Caldimonas sp.]